MKYRTYMHFGIAAPGEQVLSGMRKNCELAIYIDSEAAVGDGIIFHRSENDVLLTKGVNEWLSSKYLIKIDHIKTGEQWYPERANIPAPPKRPPVKQPPIKQPSIASVPKALQPKTGLERQRGP